MGEDNNREKLAIDLSMDARAAQDCILLEAGRGWQLFGVIKVAWASSRNTLM